MFPRVHLDPGGGMPWPIAAMSIFWKPGGGDGCVPAAGEIVTGLLFVDPDPRDMHKHMNTVEMPLNALDEAALIPGSAVLAKLNASLR